MNCHGNNENNKNQQGAHKHSPLKHMLHMVLCCGLPIIVLGSLPLISRLSPAAAGVLGRIAPFLCPIMMLLVLPMMLRGGKKGSCCDRGNENGDNNKPLELNKSEQ